MWLEINLLLMKLDEVERHRSLEFVLIKYLAGRHKAKK